MLKLAGVFGILFVLIGLTLLLAPERLLGNIDFWQTRNGQYSAAASRAFIGSVLLLAASKSRFPTGYRILGALGLIAAVIIPFVPVDNWAEFLQSVTVENRGAYQYGGSILAILVGAFIAYAALPKRS